MCARGGRERDNIKLYVSDYESYYTLPPYDTVAGRALTATTCAPGTCPGVAGPGRRRLALSACTSCSFGRIGQIAEPACHAWGVQFCLSRADAASLSGPRLPGVLSEWWGVAPALPARASCTISHSLLAVIEVPFVTL